MRIGIGNDHSALELKAEIVEYLKEHGHEVVDYGTNSTESCDYPDFAHALARGIEAGECSQGIAICGSGEGISMTLNKHQSIRAALVWLPEIAHMTRLHNDANVLVMPGRDMDTDTASKVMEEFFNTAFEGGRHQKRIDKIPVK